MDRDTAGFTDESVDSLTSSSTDPNEWLQYSGDQYNTHARIVPGSRLNKKTVKNLRQLWFFPTKTGVNGTPTYKDGTLYFGDNGKQNPKGFNLSGYFYSIKADPAKNAKIFKKDWEYSAEKFSPEHKTRNVARVSPAIAGNYLVTGTSLNGMRFIWNAIAGQLKGIPGASVIAVDRTTNQILWKTEVDSHFSSRITSSPVIYKGKVYVGVSAEESQIPGIIGGRYKCCDFRGSVVALDLASGRILWKRYTLNDDVMKAGFSGAAVWGSSFPIDEKTNTIFVGTGNNYEAPPQYKECLRGAGADLNKVAACSARFDRPDNYFDSILALDLETGDIKWATKTTLYDSWNVSCGSKITIIPPKRDWVCPKPPGSDSDFGQAPMFVRDVELDYKGKKQKLDVLVAAQKSGNVYLMDAKNGEIIWKKFTGHGGDLGGHEWGSATDGKRIFLQTTNLEHEPVTFTAGLWKGRTFRSGYWTALDLKTGATLWETPDPAHKYPLRGEKITHPLYGLNLGRGQFAAAIGPLTLYNDLLFVGSLSGNMHALDADTGAVLWSKNVGKASVNSAPSVIHDTLYWGVGYTLGYDKQSGVYSFGL